MSFGQHWHHESLRVIQNCYNAFTSHQALHRPPNRGNSALFSSRLSATYDVPVYQSLRRLRHETERWGLPGNHFLGADGYGDALGS